jgi:hypothetical protein
VSRRRASTWAGSNVSDWSDELDPSGSVEMLVARVVGYDKVCLESGREAHLGT